MAGTDEIKPAAPYKTMAYQGVAIRFVALLIDSIILWIIAFILGFLFGGFNTGFYMSPRFAFSGWAIVIFIIYIAYFTYLEGTRGQTIGKRAMGIKVVRENGSPIDIEAAFVRNILRVIDGLFAYLVGAILIWTSHKKQRLGDRAAKTVVIKA